MSTYGDPLASMIADSFAMTPQDIEDYDDAGLPDPSDEEEIGYTFDGSIKSAPVYGGAVDGNKSEQDPFISSPATPSYPKFDAAHSSYTLQSQANTYHEPNAVSPTWKSQIGAPRSPAVSNGLGFFTGVPRNVQDALANMQENTGFVIVGKDFKASNNVFGADKLKSPENYEVDGFHTPPPKSAFRFPGSGEKKVRFATPLTTPTKSKSETGFTPLIKQAEQFAATRQTPALESPTAKKSTLKEKRVAKARQAEATSTPAPTLTKKYAQKQKKKVILYAFSQGQFQYLLANIPTNTEYDIEVVLQTDGTSVHVGQGQSANSTPVAQPSSTPNHVNYGPPTPATPNNVGNGNLAPTNSGAWHHPSNQFYEWNDTFADIAELIHPEPDSPFSRPAQLTPRSPKIKLVIRPTQAQQNVNAAKVFTIFPKLPAELQLDIWKLAVPGRRTVKLSVESITALKPFHTPIPSILHTCHISRGIALKILAPSFHSVFNEKEYTFFNPRIDVLELSLPYAKTMATITALSIKNSRDLTQHVRIPFKIYTGMPMWLAMAELTLAAPHKAWPAIRSWHFPGLQIDEDGNADYEGPVELRCVWLGVKRPATVHDSETEHIVRELALKIKDKFDDGEKKYGKLGIQLGIRITYDS